MVSTPHREPVRDDRAPAPEPITSVCVRNATGARSSRPSTINR
jgi:hypothetical protein